MDLDEGFIDLFFNFCSLNFVKLVIDLLIIEVEWIAIEKFFNFLDHFLHLLFFKVIDVLESVLNHSLGAV